MSEWSQKQQKQLEAGLAQFMRQKQLSAPAKFAAIAAMVDGKDARACLVRFKAIRAKLLQRKAQAKATAAMAAAAKERSLEIRAPWPREQRLVNLHCSKSKLGAAPNPANPPPAPAVVAVPTPTLSLAPAPRAAPPSPAPSPWTAWGAFIRNEVCVNS